VTAIQLPALPLPEWEATKQTLHRYAQIIGKIRLAATAPKNHWWNAPLYVSPRGLTTRRLIWRNRCFDIELDLLVHRTVIRDDRGGIEEFALHDGLSVAQFHAAVLTALRRLDLEVPIRSIPFGIDDNTPFADDSRHASYDADAVQRYWRVLAWADSVLDEFAGWFCGKSSPVHLFWHSFDLAVTRFSGARAPIRPGADPITAEAYSHEVISFGFWPGDANTRRSGLLLVYVSGAARPHRPPPRPPDRVLAGRADRLASDPLVRRRPRRIATRRAPGVPPVRIRSRRRCRRLEHQRAEIPLASADRRPARSRRTTKTITRPAMVKSARGAAAHLAEPEEAPGRRAGRRT
jgi:Family of unknown function (DUF5996)